MPGRVSGNGSCNGLAWRAAGSGCARARRTPSVGPVREMGAVVVAPEKAWSEFVDSMCRTVRRIG